MFHRPKPDTAPQSGGKPEQSAPSPADSRLLTEPPSYLSPLMRENTAKATTPKSAQPGEKTFDPAHTGKENQSMSSYHTDDSKTDSAARQMDASATMPRAATPAMAAPRSPYTYPGSFGAQQQPAHDQNTGRKLIVGQGISLSGEIEACDHLIVEGKVEAALKGASLLDIAEAGVYYGTVEIEEAMIAGRFEGDLTVNGRLTVKSTGSITGAICYRELAVEAGAIVDGKISPMSRDKTDSRKPGKASSPAKTDTARSEQTAETRPATQQDSAALFPQTAGAAA